MAQGRCAGCGKTSTSCKQMDQHIISCPEYTALFKEDPSRALNPREEYDRWQIEENNPEARAEAKDKRLSVRFAKVEKQRATQDVRWATKPSILDD